MYYRNRKAGREHEFAGASSRGDCQPRRHLRSRLLRIIMDAADQFDQQGACPTHAIVIDRQGESSTLLPNCLPDRNTKDVFADAIARTAADMSAVAVVFLTEIWMPGERWDGVTPPSQCADRCEALFASAETFDGTTAFLWPIHRDTAGVRLGECTPVSGSTDRRFVGLLRRPDAGLN